MPTAEALFAGLPNINGGLAAAAAAFAISVKLRDEEPLTQYTIPRLAAARATAASASACARA